MDNHSSTPHIGLWQLNGPDLPVYVTPQHPTYGGRHPVPDRISMPLGYRAMRYAELMGKARDIYAMGHNCTNEDQAYAFYTPAADHELLAEHYRDR